MTTTISTTRMVESLENRRLFSAGVGPGGGTVVSAGAGVAEQALLLPAVQAAREAAQVASCTNNLRPPVWPFHG